MKYGYIAERYSPSYKLAGRGAEYYLLPHGLRTLQDAGETESLTDAIIKSSFKDKTISDQFVQRCLTLYNVSNNLSNQYNNLQLFTRRELSMFDYFPKPLPEAFISIRRENDTVRFFVELVLNNEPAFVF